ncbi:hypothetical protein KIPB_011678, partial [Kipferlia bialata]|eukprot:g11678.t1
MADLIGLVPTGTYPPGSLYGYASVIDGDWAAVSAPDAEAGTLSRAGIVYLFMHDGTDWTYTGHLADPDSVADSVFGTRIALSGNLLAVSSEGTARVHTYHLAGTTWTHVASLSHLSNSPSASVFGIGLGLSGTHLAIGSHTDAYDVSLGLCRGTVYTYEWLGGGWSSESELSLGSYVGLGHTLALDGDRLAV